MASLEGKSSNFVETSTQTFFAPIDLNCNEMKWCNKYYFYSVSGCPGRGICWKATSLTPDLAEYQHQDESDLDRHGWTPLDYFEQYIDKDLMTMIAECSNVMSLSKSGDPLNMSVDEVYHFFGACILMSCIRYPTIRMYWSS